MVNLAGSYDETAAPGGDFDPIPAGEYIAEIIDSAVDDISRRDDKGRCLKLTWRVKDGEFDGRLIWQRLNLWAENMNNLDKVRSIAEQQFAGIRHATGKVHVKDSEELHYIPCLIRVAVQVDKSGQYPPQNEIKSVKAVGGQGPASAPAPRAAPPRQPAPPANSGASAPWRQKQPA